jgi:hypothetical protein
MNGLHVCKAGNAPQVGQVKSFVVTGDRIKSKPMDQGGQNYTITKVSQSDTYKDAYGNLGFNLEIEPQNGSGPTPAPRQQAASAGWSDDRSNRIERQHSQSVAVAYATLKGMSDITSDQLVALIDWFHRDVSRMPTTVKKTESPEPEPEATDGSPDEEPF